jgi:HAE1 family hydrophobic/amphiphilic exporter-1
LELFTRAALKNPTAILLAIVAILGFGIYAVIGMPEQSFPNISRPVINIVTDYPSASPSTVLDQVTKPVEAAVMGLSNVNTVTSTSNQGFSLVTVEFNYGSDMTAAQNQVRNALSGIKLPQGANAPSISTISLSQFPFMRLALTGSNLRQLGSVATGTVDPALAAVPGVASVQLDGTGGSAVQITVRPQDLTRYHMAAGQVEQALAQDGLQYPVGAASIGGLSVPVTAGAHLSLASLGSLVVGEVPGLAGRPTPVTLADVADIQTVPAPSGTISRYDGKPSVGISLIEQPTANTVDVAQAVEKALSSIRQSLPAGVHIATLDNQATSISASVGSMLHEALLGALLAVLIIALFLGNAASTLVAIVSIPLSILISLLVLSGLGISLNIMTLGGIAVSVGRVVDDSIVLLENVFRKIHATPPGERSTMTIVAGVREVANAVTSSTVTTVAVFLPIGLVSGIAGAFFQPFAYTVVVSLAASLLVALMVNPILVRYFILHGKVPNRHDWFLSTPYRRLLQWALRRRAVVLVIAAAIFLASISLVPRIGTNFLPNSTTPTVNVSLGMPLGTPLATTEAAALRAEGVLRSQTGVLHTQIVVGSAATFGLISQTNQASFFAKVTPQTDMQSFITRLLARLKQLHVQGATWAAAPGSSFAGGSEANQIQVLVQSSNAAHLRAASRTVASILRQTQGVSQVMNELSTTESLVSVAVDPIKAAAAGLTPGQVTGQLSPYLTNAQIASLGTSGSNLPVYLRVGTGLPQGIAAVKALPIATQAGVIPLSDVASVTLGQTPASITRTNGSDTATVNAVVTTANVGAVSKTIETKIAAAHLPSGVTTSMGGVTQMQGQAFGQMGEAMVAAIFLVYLVMLLAFGEGRSPFAIMFSLPLAVIGALGGLWVSGNQLGIPALIGMLMLIGIVVTNAIVLVDLVAQNRRRGLSPRDALVEAGAVRLRPILMTALATIGALLPLAYASSGDLLISSSVAVVVIGGLLTSTLLTLVVVPVMYSLLHRGVDGAMAGN